MANSKTVHSHAALNWNHSLLHHAWNDVEIHPCWYRPLYWQKSNNYSIQSKLSFKAIDNDIVQNTQFQCVYLLILYILHTPSVCTNMINWYKNVGQAVLMWDKLTGTRNNSTSKLKTILVNEYHIGLNPQLRREVLKVRVGEGWHRPTKYV